MNLMGTVKNIPFEEFWDEIAENSQHPINQVTEMEYANLIGIFQYKGDCDNFERPSINMYILGYLRNFEIFEERGTKFNSDDFYMLYRSIENGFTIVSAKGEGDNQSYIKALEKHLNDNYKGETRHLRLLSLVEDYYTIDWDLEDLKVSYM